MPEYDGLTVPPTELEVAALADAAREGLTPAGMMILRRLAFDRDRLAAEVKRLRSNVVPGLTYACGCPAVSSGAIAAFCPTHLEPIRAALTPGEARP